MGKPKRAGVLETRGEGGVNCFRAAPVSVLGEVCSRACWEMVGWSGSGEDGAGAGGGERGGGERGGAREVRSLRI